MTTATGSLKDLGGSCHAWLASTGAWGFSNAGLVVGEESALLVDTLFDLPLTATMLTAMREATQDRPIGTLVNTHANGDHFFGNQLVEGAEIIASENAAANMVQADLDRLLTDLAEPGPDGDHIRDLFGGFDFRGITVTRPTRTFTDRLVLDVSGVEVHCIAVGPAHTDGDVIVHVPEAGTVYAGDLLFIGGTPVAWAGPLSGWVEACDLMLDLDVHTVVPGHGPVTGKDGVREVREYLAHVDRAATECYRDGRSFDDAVNSIPLGRFASWSESGRLVQNVANVYRHLDPEFGELSHRDVMARMLRYESCAG